MSETSYPHLADHVLAAYLDRTLRGPARAAAEAHLAECASCRDELVATTELAAAARRRPLVRLAAPLAAVAALLLVMVLGPWNALSRHDGGGNVLRKTTGGGTAAAMRLLPVAPSDGATLARDSVRFTWRQAALDAGYRVTVADETGGVPWTTETSDTTAVLPGNIRLTPGTTYYWYVDALVGDGRARTTGLQRFRITR